MNTHVRTLASVTLVSLLGLAACDDDPTAPTENEQELITAVELTLTPVGGGAAIVSTITDPDGLGPQPPQAQDSPIALQAGAIYTGSVRFLDTSDPDDVEDITVEVREEDDEHRVFYTVVGLAGVEVPLASLDTDGNGAPLGLSFEVVTDATSGGEGSLRVVLSHFDDEPKGDGLTPSDETDADVSFTLSVG